MSKFLKQFVFIATIIGILMVGGLAIYSATPGGKIKINPILGHDLDLNATYYAQAANNTVHDITTQDISISAWVKVDVDMPTTITLNKWFSKLQTGNPYNGYAGYFSNYKVGTTIIEPTANGGSSFAMLGNTAINDNKWHYIAVIFDRDSAVNSKIFLDGIDNTASRSGTITDVDTLTNNGLLGTSFLGGQILDGQIRDVKLYYAAGDHWSDAQVLYQAQHPFDYTANAGSLTDYWRLDEGSGTTLYGKVNNLTLSNVLAWTTQPKIKMVKQENTTTTSNNPVGWWKFDETTAIHGSSLADRSGNGNTGTLSTGDGATNKSVAGKLGRGLSFDGVNDYVDAGNGASLQSSTFSIVAWFYPTQQAQTGNFRYIASKRLGAANANWWLGIGTNSGSAGTEKKVEATIYTVNNPAGLSAHSSGDVVLNRWNYVVMTYTSGTLQIYLNGVTDGSALPTGNLLHPTEGNVVIGWSQAQEVNTRLFYGSIDDVRIYNRALTASEVAQMYNSTKDGYLGNVKVSTGLVGYWKLDDNNALTSVIDYSGKGNTGTAYSGTATSTSVLSTSTAMIGRAMSFDGVDDYISVADNDNLDTGIGNFTVSLWVKPAVIPNDSDYYSSDVVLSKGRSSWMTNGWAIAYANGSSVPWYGNGIAMRINIYTPGNNNALRLAPSTDQTALLLNGSWHYVTFSIDRTGVAYEYIDGQVVGSLAMTKPEISLNNSFNLYLGKESSTSGTGFPYYSNGLIDEVKIWNYARSAEDIKNDYIKGLANFQ